MRSFSDKVLIRDLPGEWRNLAQQVKDEVVWVDANAWRAYEKASAEYERLEKLRDPNAKLGNQIKHFGRIDHAFNDLQTAFRRLAHSFPPGSTWRKKFLEEYRKSRFPAA
jgi:hypothetical protein